MYLKALSLVSLGRTDRSKTTIIRLIMDLLQADKGSIRLFGKSMNMDEVGIKEKIGFVYSELYLNDKWTIKSRKMIAPFYKKWNHDTFYDYLNKFGLPYKKLRPYLLG